MALSEWAVRNGIRGQFFARILKVDGAANGDLEMHAKRMAREAGERARGVVGLDAGTGTALARELGRAQNVAYIFAKHSEATFGATLTEALGSGREDHARVILDVSRTWGDGLKASARVQAVGRSRDGAPREVVDLAKEKLDR